MTTQAERIATLESEVKATRKDVHEMKKSQDEMKKSQDAMLLELTKYRGLVGGVMLVCGAIWAFVSLVVPIITGHFGQKN